MTNDKVLPEDEAGDERYEATPDDDVQADEAVVDAEPAGEDLAAESDDETDFEIVDEDAEELVNADETIDDTPDKGDPEDVVIDDEEQLAEAEAVAAKARSSRPKRKVTTAPVKKDRPTPKQLDARGRAVVEKKRTTPVSFVQQSAGELKKVIWPTGDQLREYYVVVLVFVLFIITIVSALDFGFGRLLLWLLGNK